MYYMHRCSSLILAFPFFLSSLTVLESSRSAMVTVCARDDTEILWNDGVNDDFEIRTKESPERCGATDQFVVTSLIHKRSSGAHTFKVELVSTSCTDGDKPMLSAECVCEDTDVCELLIIHT